MPPASQPDVTQLLRAAIDGDADRYDAVLPFVYDALRGIAHNHLRDEHALPTLNTTALVHEAYERLVDVQQMDFQSRAHFFALASRLMRRVLVDYARHKKRLKRGGGAAHLPLHEAVEAIPHALALRLDTRTDDLLALDAALTELDAFDPRLARVVEHRYFAGMTIPETAEALGISPATVKREWTVAKAWLRRRLKP